MSGGGSTQTTTSEIPTERYLMRKAIIGGRRRREF
jgi:hypothetical protein